MKSLKSIIAFLLIFCLMTIMGFSQIGAATSVSDEVEKLDSSFKEILFKADSNDYFTIALWLSDVDQKIREEALMQKLSEAENAGLIQNKDLFKRSTISERFESSENVNLSEIQFMIDLKRKVDKTLHLQKNTQIILELIEKYDIHPENVYYSKYSPSVLLSLSKEDIVKVSHDENIKRVFLYDCGNFSYKNNHEDITYDNSKAALESNSSFYGYWQSSTNIEFLHSVYGLSGSGVRIGTNDGIPDLTQPVFENSYNNNRIIILGDSSQAPSSHGTYTSSIMIGKTSDYYAVAPNATLICGGWNSNTYVYPMSNEEMLIDEGIDILVSFVVSWHVDSPYSLCYLSYYYDYLSDSEQLPVCIPSHNYMAPYYLSHTPCRSLGYNVITVGNINDNLTNTLYDDVIDNSSLYSAENCPYKPDISAPGTYVRTPVSLNASGGGTCAATAVVTGICALLLEAKPILIGKPMLLKSILMSSAAVLPSMTDIYSDVTGSLLALNKPYGAGLIDAREAYLILDDSQYKNYVSINQMTEPVSEYTIKVKHYTDYEPEYKDIFICLSWIQQYTELGDDSYYVLPTGTHDLRLYDPNGNLVARSNYLLDRKQFIRYKPTQAGTYTIKIYRNMSNAAYYPKAALSYDMRFQ